MTFAALAGPPPVLNVKINVPIPVDGVIDHVLPAASPKDVVGLLPVIVATPAEVTRTLNVDSIDRDTFIGPA